MYQLLGQSQFSINKEILSTDEKYGLFFLYSMTVSLQKQEDFDSFVEREFEIKNLQVEFDN